MKTTSLTFTLALLSLTAAAQTNIVAAPNGLSSNPAENMELIISLATPIIVWFVNKITPEIPPNLRFLLPMSTPFIGILLASLINYLNGQSLGWWDGAKAGAIAVAVREVWNQTVTRQLTARAEAKADNQAQADQAESKAEPSAPDQNQSTT